MIHGYFWLGRILPTSMEASPSEQFVVRLLGADQSDSKTRVRRIEKFRKRNKTNFHINDWIFLKFGKLDGFPRISWNHVYIWGDVRDKYWRITRSYLTITVYLLVFVVYTSAVKTRYNYRFEITSSNSARYFTRWFESWRLHRCPEIQIRYYVRLRTNNSDRLAIPKSSNLLRGSR